MFKLLHKKIITILPPKKNLNLVTLIRCMDICFLLIISRCTLGYHGKYCEALIVYIDDWKTQLVAVLIPVLIGTAALVFLCSCCFAFFRRVNRGDREAVSVS